MMRLITSLVMLALAAAACQGGSPSGEPAPTTATATTAAPAVTAAQTPVILADSFFFGHAYVDSNANGALDDADAPLEGARLIAEGFGALTGKDGIATIVIPGGWDRPLTARMEPPKGSGYTLIGPAQAVLQSGGETSADFLFAPPAPTPAATAEAANSTAADALDAPGSIHRDLTYCTAPGGVELKMDIYQPEQIGEASPVVIYIHGGGWTSGDKNDEIGLLFGRALTRNGYLMAAINYRLAPQFRFPAQIVDVKCAVRHLRANAAAYRLDPQRIAALGASAGGHLAALLGTSDATAGFDTGEYLEQSSRVQAVVDLFGPADLVSLMSQSRRALGERVFDVNRLEPEKLAPFSPVTYITADDPPFLMLHGEQDELVPIEQSEILYTRLTAAGVPAELVRVQNAGHGFRPVDGAVNPRPLELVQRVIEFLDQSLN